MRDFLRVSPPTRLPFELARLSLITIAVLTVLVAGCGNSKTETPPAAGTNGSTPPAETSTPAVPESSATPASGTGGAPAAAGDLGSQVFVKRCVLCHGPEGRGDGIASKGLNPKPRNFHDQAYMSTRTDAQLLEVIHKGKGAMPPWGAQLSEAEITAVLAHVRELGKKP